MTSLFDPSYTPISTPSSFNATGLYSSGSGSSLAGAFSDPIDFGLSTPTQFKLADPVGTATAISQSSPALPGGLLDGLSGMEKLAAYMEIGKEVGHTLGNVGRVIRGYDPIQYQGKGIAGMVRDKQKAAQNKQLLEMLLNPDKDDADPATPATEEPVNTDASSTDIEPVSEAEPATSEEPRVYDPDKKE